MALGLGIGDARQQVEEPVGRVDIDEVCIHLVAENLDDLLGFAFAHEAVVHVHAHELLADGADEQCGNDGRIDAAGKGQEDLAVAYLLAHGRDCFLDERISQLGRRDALHVVGSFVGSEIHGCSFSAMPAPA